MNKSEHPEWLRPSDVPKIFGIGRSKVYELISEGKIRSVSLRKRGRKHGTRLVSYDSLAGYLESLAEGGAASTSHVTTEADDERGRGAAAGEIPGSSSDELQARK